jgi:hypothetical protein
LLALEAKIYRFATFGPAIRPLLLSRRARSILLTMTVEKEPRLESSFNPCFLFSLDLIYDETPPMHNGHIWYLLVLEAKIYRFSTFVSAIRTLLWGIYFPFAASSFDSIDYDWWKGTSPGVIGADFVMPEVGDRFVSIWWVTASWSL